jgi:hypothetical protein
LLGYEFSKLNDGLVQNLNKLSVATPWLRQRRATAHRQRLRARRRRAADGGRNGGTLGRAAGVARWSSWTGPRQAQGAAAFDVAELGRRGGGSVARSDWSLLKRKGMVGLKVRLVGREGEWGPGCRQGARPAEAGTWGGGGPDGEKQGRKRSR